MNFDEFFKYIGYAVGSILIFYLVAKSLHFQISVIEGLVGMKKNKQPEPFQAEEEEEDDDESDTE